MFENITWKKQEKKKTQQNIKGDKHAIIKKNYLLSDSNSVRCVYCRNRKTKKNLSFGAL